MSGGQVPLLAPLWLRPCTTPSYIYNSTVALWQIFLHFYMFSISVVELLWSSHANFFLHLAYTIPIVNAQLYV